MIPDNSAAHLLAYPAVRTPPQSHSKWWICRQDCPAGQLTSVRGSGNRGNPSDYYYESPLCRQPAALGRASDRPPAPSPILRALYRTLPLIRRVLPNENVHPHPLAILSLSSRKTQSLCDSRSKPARSSLESNIVPAAEVFRSGLLLSASTPGPYCHFSGRYT